MEIGARGEITTRTLKCFLKKMKLCVGMIDTWMRGISVMEIGKKGSMERGPIKKIEVPGGGGTRL